MIAPLEPPETHVLAAAEGWLELGNPAEAAAELQAINPQFAVHPAVLELSWQIHARERQWETCLTVAARLVELNPELPAGWIHRSYTLHELQRTAEARDLLLPALARFPEQMILKYNLACYECRLGNLARARQWLKEVFGHQHAATWRQAALGDPDLEFIRAEIPLL